MVKRLHSRFHTWCTNHHRGIASLRPHISIARILQQSQVSSEQCKPINIEELEICGFIRSIRNQKQRSFASIGDGSSIQSLQALLTPAQAKGLSYGTAVRLTGAWKPSPNPSGQSHELHVSKLDVLGPVDPSYPLQKKYQTPEYLRTIPHLRTRIPFNGTLLHLRSDAIAIITKNLSDLSFTQTHTPIITSSDCEGAGEVFRVGTAEKEQTNSPGQNFFRSQKYLTVSSQLHLEALSQSVGNVWTLSPTFRAEKSDTTRHLSEFYMLEAEMSFTDSLDEVMKLVKCIIIPIVQSLYHSQTGSDLLKGPHGEDELRRRWDGMIAEWQKITYTEAIKILQTSSQIFEHEPKWGLSLQTEHEKYIASTVGASSGKISPIFVTNFPKKLKPFYMFSSSTNYDEDDRETVDCFDLLLPEVCEIAGGSIREHRLEQLVHSMFTNGLIPSTTPSDEDLRDLKWYVDLRKWGCVPHGGFGLGFDRLLSYLAGVPHIRDMVTFPRWVGRCEC